MPFGSSSTTASRCSEPRWSTAARCTTGSPSSTSGAATWTPTVPAGDPVAAFRGALVNSHLDLAAAYYPWVNTTIVHDGSPSFENIENSDVLQQLIGAELTRQVPDAADPARAEALAAVVAKITNREAERTNAQDTPRKPSGSAPPVSSSLPGPAAKV